jgi:hypothetical protein
MRTASIPEKQPLEIRDDRARPSPPTLHGSVHAEAPRQNGPLRVVGKNVAGAGAVSQLCDRVIDRHGPHEFGV